ncbi:MAG: nitroreductase family protein, partial [Promethearchaeota archaeon]
MSEEETKKGRNFLKATELRGMTTDQLKKLPAPPLQKPYPENVKLIDLVNPEDFKIGRMAFIDVLNKRRSRRKFTKDLITLEELSFLLWATQGVQYIIGGGNATWRTVPSGGARHPFETYLCL